ncbi:MAG: SDR family NAD(P)-dependent oxidoreductase [Achromobacter veterisilvae]
MRMANKNVVVTGGASGIGLATARRCLEEGARVVIADLAAAENSLKAAQAADPLLNTARFIAADVTSADSVDALFRELAATWNAVDGVFNNAGIARGGPAVDVRDEDYLRVLDVNLHGVFRVARAAMRAMFAQGHGSIVNCASVLGSSGRPGASAYCASKGGVVNLTRALAMEAAPFQVRINSVSPGFVDTPLLAAMPDDRRQALLRLHPMGRLGRDTEIAHAVLFLLSDEASFVTGSNLVVDGGYSAGKE